MLVLVWVPLQKYILNIDGSARSILFAGILTAILTRKKLAIFSTALKIPLNYWTAWTLYTSLMIVMKSSDSSLTASAAITNVSVPLVFMSVCAIEGQRNIYRLIRWIIASLFVSLILISLFEQYNQQGRLGLFLNSNSIAIYAVVFSMLTVLGNKVGVISSRLLIAVNALSLYLVLESGSRTAFIGLTLLFLLYSTANANVFTLIKRLILFVCASTGAYLTFLRDSLMLERLLGTTSQSSGKDFETGIWIFDMLGDRGFYYVRGLELWIQSPWTGIGLGNFRLKNQFSMDQHSEYMIQLCELGVIGFSLFVLFYSNLFRQINQLNTRNNNLPRLLFGLLVILLLMVATTRMYRVWYMYAIPGIILAVLHSDDINRA